MAMKREPYGSRPLSRLVEVVTGRGERISVMADKGFAVA
jgi:hypothetical protein